MSPPAPGAPGKKAPAKPEAQGPTDEERNKMIEGEWCLRTRYNTGAKERVLDGSMWTFFPDGKFRHDAEVPVAGEWKLDKDQLSLGEVGTYEVVGLSRERMVLRSSNMDHEYHRECGEELDRVRRVQKMRMAASKGDTLMTMAFLDTGVDVNAVDELDTWRRTALLAAAQEGHEETVGYLLDRGANVAVANATGKTPFDLARTKPKILNMLVAHLTVPESLDAPVLVTLAAGGGCPASYLALETDEVCVHVYALPRPHLRAEIDAFTKDGTSPVVGSYRPEQEVHPEEEEDVGSKEDEPVAAEDQDGPLDLSKLDPAALMNLDSIRSLGKSRSASAALEKKFEELDPVELKNEWCRLSKKAVEEAHAGKNQKYADALGISKAEHAAKLEKKYRDECL